jgi:5-methylcytosine-specific restriction protein A
MSTRRTQCGGWANQSKLPKGPNGRNLCRRCAAEVPKGRLTFCSDGCVHEWKLRTDPAYLRQCVFDRDHGICAECGVNAVESDSRYLHRKRSARGTGHLWQADHIVPVVEGGGECDLSNLRTLCTACHKRATADLAARRAEQRRAERAQASGQMALMEGATT